MERKIGIIGYGSMGKMISSKFIQSKIINESHLFISNRTFEKINDLNEIYTGKLLLEKEMTFEPVPKLINCARNGPRIAGGTILEGLKAPA
jgi:pyrroline-5-carboxylate reductase/competence protein ComER